MNLDAVNIAYGLENIQLVGNEMEENVKKFANDTIKILHLTEKLKLMHIQADPGCKGNKKTIIKKINYKIIIKNASLTLSPARNARLEKLSSKRTTPFDA